MVKKFMNKQSKRMSCRKKYKIIRKVAEHNRKLRKEKRKNPGKFSTRKADPGVPNSLPFKDEILAEAAEYKRLKEEEQLQKREEAKQRRKEMRDNVVNKKRNIGSDINQMIETAEQRGNEFEKRKEQSDNNGTLSDRSAKSFYREFKKVVENANVILEVLDARDPLGTRCVQMEEAVTSQPGKRLVLVLNKADLVPRENLEKWLKYLRREHPTVVFKACTQTQSNNLGRSNASALNSDAMNSSRCVGADVLMQLLKNYCRTQNVKVSIDVGVVGLPNVGKSSLINSLKRSRSCGVGAMPGFTKNMQTIQLDSKIRLLDSPGIVLPGGDVDDGVAALRNTVKIEALEDPIKPVQAIYNKCDKTQLLLFYRLPEFKDYDEFLVTLAKRLGKLKKGGVPDVISAAKAVLHDWTVGRIKYYTEPPIIQDTQVSATIVNSFTEEFSLDSLKENENNDLAALPLVRPSEAMCMETSGPITSIKEDDSDIDWEEDDEGGEESDGEQMEDDDQLNQNVHIDLKTKEDNVMETEEKPEVRMNIEYDPSKMSLKKYQKLVSKKKRKEANRNIGRTESLLNAFESMGSIDDKDSYNFKDYFNCK